MEREIFNFKLLYVEDEEESRREMARFLKRRFSRVILAADGREGLEKFEEHQPDMVITDLLMPNMDGIEMIAECRRRGAECPVFITSALEDVRSILKTVDLGIVKYIIKPIDTEDLSDTLEKTARKLQRRQSPFPHFDMAHKKEIERALRLGISSLLKNRSGKGPRDVSVFIGPETIEVNAAGGMTPFEETMLAGGENRLVVEQNRRLFYAVIQGDLERAMTAALGCRAEFKECRINIAGQKDRLVFAYFP